MQMDLLDLGFREIGLALLAQIADRNVRIATCGAHTTNAVGTTMSIWTKAMMRSGYLLDECSDKPLAALVADELVRQAMLRSHRLQHALIDRERQLVCECDEPQRHARCPVDGGPDIEAIFLQLASQVYVDRVHEVRCIIHLSAYAPLCPMSPRSVCVRVEPTQHSIDFPPRKAPCFMASPQCPNQHLVAIVWTTPPSLHCHHLGKPRMH